MESETRTTPIDARLSGAAGPFVGREADLAVLEALFAEERRLVTVAGPGGMGKTRLALEFVRARLEDAGDPVDVCWGDMVEATAAGGVCDAVAAALQVPEPEHAADADTAGRLGRVLAARGPLLVVLDNADRAVEATGEAVAAWLAVAPEARFLVTSRERLRLPEEVVHELPPLAVPAEGDGGDETAAVALFVFAARRVDPRWERTDEVAPSVAGIVRLLDGIPLAIELAAPRLAVMGPRALLHRLQTRLEVLRGPGRGAPARHATLRETIAFSWDVLEPWERDALAQCTVFHGGFSMESAEAVIDLSAHAGAPPVMDVVQTLRDRSMLHACAPQVAPEEIRLGLYDTIREFAAEQRGDEAAWRVVEDRHATEYVVMARGWVAKLDTHDGLEALRRLLLDRANLLAVAQRVVDRGSMTAAAAEPALEALLLLAPVLLQRGPLEAYAQLMKPVLTATARSGADPVLYCRALALRGQLQWHRGRSREGAQHLVHAFSMAREVGAPGLLGPILLSLGHALVDRGELAAGREHFEEARRLHAGAGEVVGEARAVRALARLEVRQGRVGRAQQLLEEALAMHQAGRAVWERATDLRLLGELLLDRRMVLQAAACLEESRDLCSQLEDRRGEALARGLLAQRDHDAGELDAAREAYQAIADDLGRLGFAREEGRSTLGLAVLARQQLRGIEAQALLTRAGALLRRDAVVDLEGLLRAHRAGLAADMGRTDDALALLAEARAILGGNHPYTTVCDLQQAHLAPDSADRAIRHAEPVAADCLQVRLAIRCLRAVIARGEDRTAAEADPDDLVVGDGGAWFRAPGGKRVGLHNRRPLRLLIHRLARHRQQQPGKGLAWDEMFAAGWPGERVIPEAGAHRVRVAVSTLRKLGLRSVLLTDEIGYLLDPAVATHLVKGGDR